MLSYVKAFISPFSQRESADLSNGNSFAFKEYSFRLASQSVILTSFNSIVSWLLSKRQFVSLVSTHLVRVGSFSTHLLRVILLVQVRRDTLGVSTNLFRPPWMWG